MPAAGRTRNPWVRRRRRFRPRPITAYHQQKKKRPDVRGVTPSLANATGVASDSFNLSEPIRRLPSQNPPRHRPTGRPSHKRSAGRGRPASRGEASLALPYRPPSLPGRPPRRPGFPTAPPPSLLHETSRFPYPFRHVFNLRHRPALQSGDKFNLLNFESNHYKLIPKTRKSGNKSGNRAIPKSQPSR